MVCIQDSDIMRHEMPANEHTQIKNSWMEMREERETSEAEELSIVHIIDVVELAIEIHDHQSQLPHSETTVHSFEMEADFKKWFTECGTKVMKCRNCKGSTILKTLVTQQDEHSKSGCKFAIK